MIKAKEFKCEVCASKYRRKVWKGRQTSRFCSNECKNKRVGTWVKGNPLKFKWETATEEEQMERLKINYYNLVIKNDGCWGWKGNTNSRRGYGRVTFKSKSKSISAHRASWLIHRGRVPEGMNVLHKCDNKMCTNPDHLFLGTAYENVRDMVYKNRQARGENSARSKLKENEVIDIKKMLAEGIKRGEIASKYGVTPEAISAIKTGKNWKHVK
jgi:endogenous inhibitor of DNA gyrase (YacG/DUF329 family)